MATTAAITSPAPTSPARQSRTKVTAKAVPRTVPGLSYQLLGQTHVHGRWMVRRGSGDWIAIAPNGGRAARVEASTISRGRAAPATTPAATVSRFQDGDRPTIAAATPPASATSRKGLSAP